MFAFNMKNTLISNMITKRIICTGMMLVVTLGLQANTTSSPSISKNYEGKGLQAPQNEFEELNVAEFGTVMFKIGDSNPRYLKATFDVTSSNPKIADKIKENYLTLRDAAKAVMSSHLNDIENPVNRSKVREIIRKKLVAEFNRMLGKKMIDQVYFSEFVVQ